MAKAVLSVRFVYLEVNQTLLIANCYLLLPANLFCNLASNRNVYIQSRQPGAALRGFDVAGCGFIYFFIFISGVRAGSAADTAAVEVRGLRVVDGDQCPPHCAAAEDRGVRASRSAARRHAETGRICAALAP